MTFSLDECVRFVNLPADCELLGVAGKILGPAMEGTIGPKYYIVELDLGNLTCTKMGRRAICITEACLEKLVKIELPIPNYCREPDPDYMQEDEEDLDDTEGAEHFLVYNVSTKKFYNEKYDSWCNRANAASHYVCAADTSKATAKLYKRDATMQLNILGSDVLPIEEVW